MSLYAFDGRYVRGKRCYAGVVPVLHGWVVIITYDYAYVRGYWAYFTRVDKPLKTVQKLPVFGHKYYESRNDRTGNEASVVERCGESRTMP